MVSENVVVRDGGEELHDTKILLSGIVSTLKISVIS